MQFANGDCVDMLGGVSTTAVYIAIFLAAMIEVGHVKWNRLLYVRSEIHLKVHAREDPGFVRKPHSRSLRCLLVTREQPKILSNIVITI